MEMNINILIFIILFFQDYHFLNFEFVEVVNQVNKKNIFVGFLSYFFLSILGYIFGNIKKKNIFGGDQ